jgi:hypothetical protein
LSKVDIWRGKAISNSFFRGIKLQALVGPAPEHPCGGGQSGNEALGPLEQLRLIEGLAERLGSDTRSTGGGLDRTRSAQSLITGHFLVEGNGKLKKT